MPEICSFNGMRIKMLWMDHLPKHLHIFVGSERSRVTFEGDLLSGSLEPDKLKSLRAWIIKRRAELDTAWEKALRKEAFERIEP